MDDQLKPGDPHYQAFVGPPNQYDFMGATQFRLLTTLGLRASDSLLDLGCGSLRAGRFFISYLDEGRYCGIEPNRWLVQEAIKNQLGQSVIDIKKPHFDYNADFDTTVFDRQFDFILAQSIFSHTGYDLTETALRNCANSLKPQGMLLATFVEGPSSFEGRGWIYPGCVRYRRRTIAEFGEGAGLNSVRLPWYHPRQTWYAFARDPGRLPRPAMLRHLRGIVFFQAEFSESLSYRRRFIRWARTVIPENLQRQLGRWRRLVRRPK